MAKAETEEIELVIRYIKEKITLIELTMSDPFLRLAKMQEMLKNPLSGLNRTEANHIIKKFFSGHLSAGETLTGGRRRNSLGEVVQSNNINQRNMSSTSYDQMPRAYVEIEVDHHSPNHSSATTPRDPNNPNHARDQKATPRDQQRRVSTPQRRSSSRRSSQTSVGALLPATLQTPPRTPPSETTIRVLTYLFCVLFSFMYFFFSSFFLFFTIYFILFFKSVLFIFCMSLCLLY